MDKIQQYRATRIQALLFSPDWQHYEDFINSLILDKINSPTPKEVLAGLKMSIDEAKKLVALYEKNKD